MDVSRKILNNRRPIVGLDLIDQNPSVDYQSIWSVSFALENEITKINQFNFIQDPV